MKSHLATFKERPLSWSSLSSFAYDKEAWARKYLLGISDPANAKMEFGKKVGTLLATVPDFLPMVPRLPIYEQELKFKIGSISIVGYLDSFDPINCAYMEYKTTSNHKKWTKESAQDHGQCLLYHAGIWLLYGTPPEDIQCFLVSIPCEETGDFKISLSKKPVQIFEIKHTKLEVVNFLVQVKKTYKSMCDFALNYKNI